jgi:hypothetical protein
LQEKLPGSIVINDVFPLLGHQCGPDRGAAGRQRLAADRGPAPGQPDLFLALPGGVAQPVPGNAVSADKRYGPVYNLGVAKEVWRTLLRHGYRPGSNKPVTLIGTSGGGQVSVGSATYLS